MEKLSFNKVKYKYFNEHFYDSDTLHKIRNKFGTKTDLPFHQIETQLLSQIWEIRTQISWSTKDKKYEFKF
jgi:hypothetical protein